MKIPRIILSAFSAFLIATLLVHAKPHMIQKSGPHTWKIHQDAFSTEGQAAEALLGEDIVEPSFLYGEKEEIEMVKIHSGSLLDQAGLGSGDRIVAIDGNALDGAWSVLGLLQELKESNNIIQIQIARKGKIVTQDYLFEGDSLRKLAGIFIRELMGYLNPL